MRQSVFERVGRDGAGVELEGIDPKVLLGAREGRLRHGGSQEQAVLELQPPKMDSAIDSLPCASTQTAPIKPDQPMGQITTGTSSNTQASLSAQSES
jgi:hypothetical protein